MINSKLKLYSILKKLKSQNKKIYGISAPSRASTLINYVGLDENIIDCVLEIDGSYKIGNYIPGKLPVRHEDPPPETISAASGDRITYRNVDVNSPLWV